VSIIATIVGVTVATLLSMIIGELVPKNWPSRFRGRSRRS
jgi:CBS domain containing-hemolysin-like protein